MYLPRAGPAAALLWGATVDSDGGAASCAPHPCTHMQVEPDYTARKAVHSRCPSVPPLYPLSEDLSSWKGKYIDVPQL